MSLPHNRKTQEKNLHQKNITDSKKSKGEKPTIIYCNLFEKKSPKASVIKGQGDEVLTELISLMIGLRKNKYGAHLLSDAYEMSADPEVVKRYEKTFRTEDLSIFRTKEEFKA